LFRILIFLVLVSSLLLNCVLAFKFLWPGRSKRRTWAVRASASAFALAYLLAGLELACMLSVHSDSFGFTLASKRWFAQHWHPINSMGYRDVEYSLEDLRDEQLVLAVGDSFVAGHGIRDYRDRFSNVLEGLLGPRWRVLNIAKNGWDTRDELAAIRAFGKRPRAVVLTYYYNDIESAARARGLEPPVPFAPPPAFAAPLLARSYLLDFLYWRLYRFLTGPEIDRAAWEFYEQAYERPDVWNDHARELLEIARTVQQEQIELYVVVFPNLRMIERSGAFTSKVVDLLASGGAHVIDLATILEGREPRSLIVNRLDNHPGVALHREVAELLHERIARPR
jgi:hypothetical protein